MTDNVALTLKEAVGRLVAGDAQPIIAWSVRHMPPPFGAAYTVGGDQKAFSLPAGWLFGGRSGGALMMVVVTPGVAALTVLIWAPRWVMGAWPTIEIDDCYTLGVSGGRGVLSLGERLAQGVVAQADLEDLSSVPTLRTWSAAAGEAIRSAIDRDPWLRPYGPPGWEPGATKEQVKIRRLLTKEGMHPVARARQLAERLVNCGSVEYKIVPGWLREERLVARFGSEAELRVDWRRSGLVRDRDQRAAVVSYGVLIQPATAYWLDIRPLMPVLLPELARLGVWDLGRMTFVTAIG